MSADMPERKPLDLAALRSLLRTQPGPELWRSLDQLAETREFREALEHEFPWRTAEHVEGMNRRQFWKLMGAAFVMAGLEACTRQPPENIVPYVNQPALITQGVPLYFATAMPYFGRALGLVVKSHMGHPVKIEGNPRHPASLGATDTFAQTAHYDLYDPNRSATIFYQGRISTWVEFAGRMLDLMTENRANGGARVRLLTETVISPTLGQQIAEFQRQFPAARWHQWQPVSNHSARLGSEMAFGRFLNTVYRFEQADRILSIDADFVAPGAGLPRYAHDFALRRASRSGAQMNRMYAVESTPSPTGGSADHRLSLRPSEMEPFLRAVAQGVGAPGGVPPRPEHRQWATAVSEDLAAHRGRSLVIAGYAQSPLLHALAHGINAALGNVGTTLVYTDPIEASPVDEFRSLRELVDDMRAGKVDVLIMLGGNPVYDAPDDLYFVNALSFVKHRIHLGMYDDQTSVECEWHVPQTHFLEEWSDCVTYDGTASIVQPLIAPIYEGRSAHEVMGVLLGDVTPSGYDRVRAYWQTRHGGGDFELFWVNALHDGIVAGTALPPVNAALAGDFAARVTVQPAAAQSGAAGPYEILFRPDPTIWDGRFADNPYQQELAKPLSKITWDAVALASPATASRIGAYSYAVVKLQYAGREILFPLWVQPGHADDCVTVYLGYGRTRAGRTGETGYNAYPLRKSTSPWWDSGLSVVPTRQSIELACTQNHYTMDSRFPVRMGTLDTYLKDRGFARHEPFETAPPPGLTLYPEWRYDGYKWGMQIDLNACVGCNACVVACDMENNTAVVGKEEVFRYREMHWLRVDRYFQGNPESPDIWFQPVPCMQCENAPCELVCPVEATVHSSEGLNQMIYNRCVGTRFCSNNCPYKVRRFNFFLYSDWYDKPLEEMRNPDVTVRSRGVMEKCTYCVQRIEHAKIQSEKENRRVHDGEIQTACQQACPAQAIVFGDLNDRNSRVSRLKSDSLTYGLLAELNTRPRTTYMARVLNLNPRLRSRLI